MPAKKPAGVPDYGQRVLGDNPAQTLRILGLVRAGHTFNYIVRLGHHQQAWSPADVRRVVKDNRVSLPEPPDALHSANGHTTARTAALTTRQAEAVHHLCHAKSDPQIAHEMGGITVATVRSYINKSLRATKCATRLDLVVQILTGQLVPTITGDDDDE